MDFEYQIKTLPPEALEVIRYYSTLDTSVAHAHQITGATHLSERAFGRAIRRLVTRGYLNMDGEGRYRLTDLGRRAVETFAATDDGTDYAAEVADAGDTEEVSPPVAVEDDAPVADVADNSPSSYGDDDLPDFTADDDFPDFTTDDAPSSYADDDFPEPDAEDDTPAPEPEASPTSPLIEARTTTRRLVVALPQTLIAGQPATVHVGFENAAAPSSAAPADLLVRLSMLNGEPGRAQDWSVTLNDDSASKTFEVTAGEFTQARLRVIVFQLLDDGNEVEQAGGLYIDVDVTLDSDSPAPLIAYGVDVPLAL